MTVTVTKTKNGLPPEKISGGHLRLPDGRRVDDVRLHELSKIFRDLNIEGINPEMGKQELAVVYSKHLGAMKDAAGNSVIDAWMEKHRPKLTKGAEA